MAKSEGQRLKLFYLYDILREHTDSRNLLSRAEIERLLRVSYGIEVDKKTFYTDMNAIEEYAKHELIRKKTGREFRYGMPDEMRVFTPAELKLLADSVLSAKFLTEGQSSRFIRKLESQCSGYDARLLRRRAYLPGRTRTEQTEVFESVDVLNKAIIEDRQVIFHYFDRNVNMDKQYGHNGNYYRVSPWALTWDDGKYYLVGDDMDSNDRNIRHYRVDKMEDVQMTGDCRALSEKFDGLKENEYSYGLFGMFGGDTNRVTLVCENRMAGVIVDRFGYDIMLGTEDKDHFRTTVHVVDSEQFYAWIASLGPGVRITGPEAAVEKMRKMACRLYETYKKEES